ncbi:MAG: radical SAM protein, partial [Methanomassiliicoccaceae archaeon]|nr:radical SAM protein [Methanomassiliicoccaceae archaeon]
MAMGEMFGYAKWWLGSLFGSKAPLVNTLVIHYGCNLRCKHCSIHGNSLLITGKNELSYGEIVADLELQFKNGARIAYFEGGETTLWKDGDKDLGSI